MLEQLAVKLETDGGDVAALFRAEQIAGAADLKVAHGNFKPAAQRGILPDGADAFAHIGEQAYVARQQQIGIGLVLVTPDPPAQLVKVAQAKPVGAVNDYGVRVWNIQAALDDGGGQQDIRLAIDELGHDRFQFVRIHLAVTNDQARVGQKPFQAVGHGLNRHYAIVQEKNLPAAIQLALDGIADDALVELGDNGLDRQPVMRRGLDGAHVARTGEREVKRAGNGRGAEREHVHLCTQPFELFLVQHAEPLLLINHHEAEVLEKDVVLNQPVRADDHVHAAVGQIFDDALLLAAGAKAREQFDANGIIGQALPERVEMLLRQHSRRHQHGDLLSVHHGLERGADGDLGFAKADVATNQAIHRLGFFHVGFGFLNGAPLIGGFLKKEGAFKLALPGCVGFEGVAGLGFAHSLDLQ